MALVEVTRLRRMVREILHAHDVPEPAAQLQSDLLIAAELRGHPSHGVLRLRRIVERIRAGVADPRATGRHEWAGTALLRVDGEQGLGPVVAMSALDAVQERARSTGVAAAVIRHNNHLGMLGWYVEQVARAGQVAVATCTSEALVHPWGGRHAMIGTNPIAIGVPARPHPLVLDMATGLVSMGKIHDYANRGLPLPPGWALDAAGEPTTDARAATGGSIAPFGDAKGYALALSLEVLVATLTASETGTAVRGTLDSDRPSTKGDLFLVFDRPPEAVRESIGAYLQAVRDAEPSGDVPVQVPGDRSRLRSELTLAQGIEIADEVWRHLSTLHNERSTLHDEQLSARHEQLSARHDKQLSARHDEQDEKDEKAGSEW
ncbi:Ldh family oxidoreductase [Plantactinospora mayteni]|uniref:Dehydrogenase n=1 Tax=Plantactinospora mayteni TaxID=566021 RepID=A0ABQ4EHB9_9ACTN|nr:Ldh family oxidoreductase [Plantactinospora mayteni]GIG94117.1 dehydrogenase [Plantactinospora mayteni]